MRLKEQQYRGFTLRHCDLPAHVMVDHNGHRSKDHKAMKLSHWKVMRNKTTITTAETLKRAKDKADMLAMGEMLGKGLVK